MLKFVDWSQVVPDREGSPRDVVLGFDEAKEYASPFGPYFGCTVGRFANRIGGASFEVDGQRIRVTAANSEN